MPRPRYLIVPLILLILIGCSSDIPETDAIPVAQNTIAPTNLPPDQPTATIQSEEAPTPTALPPIKVEPLIIETAPFLDLEVELFYNDHWLRVTQVTRFQNTTADTWDQVAFNIPLNSLSDTFFMDAGRVDVQGKVSEEYPFLDQYQTALRIDLPRQAKPGETVEVTLDYRIVIPPVASTDWPPIGTTGWTFDLIQAGEWYPSPVPYIEGEGWYTWDYHPVGDPTIYPLINYEMTIIAEEGIIVASGGLVEQEGTRWHYAVNGGRGIGFTASDRYELLEAEVDGIPVQSYFLPEHSVGGQAALDIAIESLRLFSDLYGPYPYDSLTVAENGFLGGMEYSAFTSISGYVYLSYGGEAPSFLHALVSHEVAHQWWYGAVGNDQTREPWLDESLAFYSELLYFEHYYPDLTDWWWVQRVDQFHPQGPVDVSIYSYEFSSDFILWMYGQAARFTDDLRTLMGDEDFFAFLQDHYQSNWGQMTTAADFLASVEAHTEEDITPLLNKYFSARFIEAQGYVVDEEE